MVPRREIAPDLAARRSVSPHCVVVRSRFSRLSLFWRLQISGWGLFAIAAFPLKLAAFPPLTAVALTLLRDPLSLLLLCGLRPLRATLSEVPP